MNIKIQKQNCSLYLEFMFLKCFSDYQRTTKNEFRIALPQWATNLTVATPYKKN